MSTPDTKLTAQTNPELASTDSSMTFHTANREFLRITNEARLVIGDGLSKDEATQETAKLLIAAFENEIQEMVQARVAAIKKRNPSWCCQKCGNNIGWIGRFVFPFLHNCKEASK
jgi:RNA polymerase-binding transcription factor DksA